MQAKNVRFFSSFALVIGLALLATPVFGQGVAFQASSLPQQARVEGLTETMGAVVLQATAAGTILTGSSITVLYSGTITNTPTIASLSGSFGGVTCAGAGCTGGAGSTGTFGVTVSGNQLTLSIGGGAGTYIKFGAADYIVISQVRVNVNGLGSSVGTVTATMSGTSSAPTSNPITFTQSTVPVASVVSPSLAVAVNGNNLATPVLQTCSVSTSTFNVVVTERYPAALTTLTQESSFTPSYPPNNGTSVTVSIAGVPSGMGVLFSGVNAANSTFSGASGASFVNASSNNLIVGNGSFSFTTVGGLTSASEVVQFDFRIGSLNSAQTALSSTSIAAIGTTQNVTASVTLGPVQAAASGTVAFAGNNQGSGTAAVVGDCVTNLLFPFATNQVGFDTSIQISNTSSDALAFSSGNATKANGVCTLTLYPTDLTTQTATASGTVGTPSQITTPSIAAGGVYSFLLSGSSFKNQSGYIFAVCRFLDAHGFGFVLNGPQATATISQGLLALVIPNNSITNGRVNTAATASCTGTSTVGACSGLGCTNGAITQSCSPSVNAVGSPAAANLSYEATAH